MLFLAGLRAVFPRLRRRTLPSRTLRAVMARQRAQTLPSRTLRAVLARRRAHALPSRIVPTTLARFRYIDDRLFVPHCAIIDFATVQALQAVMLRAVLARQRADALPAAGLPVVRTAFRGWTALLTYCGEVFYRSSLVGIGELVDGL